ncbi:PREDICTED: probable mitochondrial chaperone BCS1-B [Brassica oleracea var. oleracea]|uniref:AAA+ ATPase domain-containing protein n=1 Tax=Brassica oleracea var. oleracea TaxID=109376 RepID=A0A0D3EC48_BRAOL|nr:PREDICTED: probable mitochondrial chaperone BCS1-B [Brassica oleracea var. oleracea]
MKEYWTSLASLLGVLAFCQSLMQSIFPPELRFAFLKFFNRIFHLFSSYCYFDITEIDGVNTNELYNAVQLYLSSSVSIAGNRLSLTRAVNSSSITFGLSNNDSIVDTFNNVTVLWEHVVTQRQTQTFAWRPLPEEKRGFTLCIKKRDKALILSSYLDYIMERANEIRRKNQDRLLYTNSRGGSLDSRGHPWESVPFKHPSTFETLAMDPVKKQQIMDDLKDFAEGQMFYQKTGRAWKRGYLLYGPPGTGKSSMIAAMANHLGYDIYDLELTEVHSNSELRKLLMKTSSKSIIVIEDIDCSINLTNRKKNSNATTQRSYYDMETRLGTGSGEESGNGGNTITLSGLLNFTDGLWSCCGSERIFVFTTNHIDKLDPALLRSGRMDMHIHMSYCDFPSLKILLKNYLGYEEEDVDDDVLKEMERVVEKAEMTPADVSEALIKNRRDKDRAVRELLEDVKSRGDGNVKDGNVKDGKLRGQSGNLTELEILEEEEKRAIDSQNEEEDSDEEEIEVEDNICKD